jgi:hypothetical protein
MDKFFLAFLLFSSFVLSACQQSGTTIETIPTDLTTSLRAPAFPLVTWELLLMPNWLRCREKQMWLKNI